MNKTLLILGDGITIAILTLIGFASHSEADFARLPRMAAIFFPTLACWFFLASLLNLFDLQTASLPKNLLRVVSAAVFCTPLAAVIRGALLHGAILPVFVFVLMAVNSLGLFIWRGVFLLFAVKSKPNP